MKGRERLLEFSQSETIDDGLEDTDVLLVGALSRPQINGVFDVSMAERLDDVLNHPSLLVLVERADNSPPRPQSAQAEIRLSQYRYRMLSAPLTNPIQMLVDFLLNGRVIKVGRVPGVHFNMAFGFIGLRTQRDDAPMVGHAGAAVGP